MLRNATSMKQARLERAKPITYIGGIALALSASAALLWPLAGSLACLVSFATFVYGSYCLGVPTKYEADQLAELDGVQRSLKGRMYIAEIVPVTGEERWVTHYVVTMSNGITVQCPFSQLSDLCNVGTAVQLVEPKISLDGVTVAGIKLASLRRKRRRRTQAA